MGNTQVKRMNLNFQN